MWRGGRRFGRLDIFMLTLRLTVQSRGSYLSGFMRMAQAISTAVEVLSVPQTRDSGDSTVTEA